MFIPAIAGLLLKDWDTEVLLFLVAFSLPLMVRSLPYYYLFPLPFLAVIGANAIQTILAAQD